METSRAYARELLYRVIEDTQDTIRSLDAKAGVGIVILGAVLGWVLNRGVRDICRGSWVVLAAFALFILFSLLGAVLAIKVLFPMVNPTKHVGIEGYCRPAFFVSGLERTSPLRLFSSSERFATLRLKHADYYASIRYASEEEVEKTLAAEALKLAFIRQLKSDRLMALAGSLTLAIVCFVVLVVALPDRRQSAPARGEVSSLIFVDSVSYPVARGQSRATNHSSRITAATGFPAETGPKV